MFTNGKLVEVVVTKNLMKTSPNINKENSNFGLGNGGVLQTLNRSSNKEQCLIYRPNITVMPSASIYNLPLNLSMSFAILASITRA